MLYNKILYMNKTKKMSDFTTIEFEDYNHQHKLLQFFAKHATIIPTHSSRIKPKYLFDSNNKIVEGSKEFIKSLLLPYEGIFHIEYNDLNIVLTIRNKDSNQFLCMGNYSVDTLGKSCDSIVFPKIFTIEIHNENVQAVNNLFENIINDTICVEEGAILKIFFNKWEECWSLHSSYEYQETSSEENLFLQEGVMNNIISGIDKFIKNKERYERFNIKHKLTYLLEGKPGMGKTTLTRIIANHYKRDLYVLSLAKKGLTDTNVIELIRKIPQNVIVLIEDLDSFFRGKTREETSVCLSTMLNILDGFMSSGEGLITFITANDAKVISDKLLRPGRIDRVIHFGEMTRFQFDAAWNIHVGKNNEPPSDELFRICQNGKMSMSSLIHILFYGETTDERIHLARQLINERKFDSEQYHMYS